MANYQLLKADIDEKVYQNGHQEITGENLNSVLNAMVTTLGAEYQFAGVATIDTKPGTPDAKVFYIANGKGTYTNFGSLEVTEDEVVVLYYDTEWHKVATGIASNEKLTELESKTDQQFSQLGQLFGLELYKTQTGYPVTNQQRIVSFSVDMKAGRFYTFSIDETPAGCLTYVDVYTSNFATQLFRLDAGSNYIFYAKQNYASIAIIMRAGGSIQDGVAQFNVYENQFIRSDYFANILKLESETGIKYTETQSATTAEWHFEKVIDGRKGYIRIYSNDEIRESNFSIPGQTSIPINSYFKYIDATALSGTKVYVSSNANATLYLEFIDEYVLSNAIFGTQERIEKTFEIAFRGETSMVPIVVKKDGTGDFTTIQEAINSIHDASVIKQYDIQVWDDFEITDLTKLWMLDYPNTHVGANPSSQCALVITKDYVNVRGMGRKRKLSVISPNTTSPSSFPNIQVIIPRGNCKISNFDVVLQGGRYAIHQEIFGSLNLNENATTILEDLNVTHLGNSMYSGGSAGWSASLAQANGAASGCHWIYKNCVWNAKEQGAPMYMHLNPKFSEPADIEFINCAFIPQVSLTLAQSVNQCFINDLGSNMGAKVKLRGNSFTGFNAFSFATIKGDEQTRVSDDICEGEINYIGDSNLKMVVNIRENPSLAFRSIADNVTISVVGGTAYDALWGGTYASFGGSSASSNVKGICVGRRKIYDQPDSGKTSIFSLAYRLGNCANEAKTLVLNVGGTEYTLTFNQNYMTSDGSAYSYNTTPRYTNAEIIAQINAMFPEILEAQIGGWKEIQTPADAKMGGIVFTNNNIEFGKVVAFIKDYGGSYNRLVPATIPNNENRILIGVICASANRGNASMVALADKNYFPMSLLYPDTAPAGTFFKVVSGNLVITTTESEASFYAIDDATIAFYDGKKRLG